MSENKRKPMILIVDDSAMNRIVIKNILGDEFDYLEASDGEKALDILGKNKVDMITLDIIMPKMDGIKFLRYKKEMKEETPVVCISANNLPNVMEQAYDLGAIDYITRPFSTRVLLKKIQHDLIISAKEKDLIEILYEQMVEKETNVSSLILILSAIVETRNMESASHVVNINLITEMLLHQLIQKTDRYHIDEKDIEEIKIASSLHDIGKIAIPDHILNKPMELSEEEFDIMKTHAYQGYVMLKKNEYLGDNSLLERAKEIARHHHEKWDGKGYPDGLIGDDIPISAQVVSIADCYDALTTKRVYKDAYSHDVAVKMINDGECGQFNPLILECFNECSHSIKDYIANADLEQEQRSRARNNLKELLKEKLNG